MVNKEIDDGERELATKMSKAPAWALKPEAGKAKTDHRAARRDERQVRKELKTIESTIAKLDTEKKNVTAELMKATDQKEAMRLHRRSGRRSRSNSPKRKALGGAERGDRGGVGTADPAFTYSAKESPPSQ